MCPVRMLESTPHTTHGADDLFRHDALFYAGRDDFVEQVSAFIRAGIEAGEPTLVVVSAEKIDALRERLGGDAPDVQFADMGLVGDNPARIIPAWQSFLEEHAVHGRRVRGVGEPISAARNAAELIECQRHESLLNLAFADSGPWWLICPYDTTALDPFVIEEARRSHPGVIESGLSAQSDDYRGLTAIADAFDHPLPEPAAPYAELPFDATGLGEVRTLVRQHARNAGLSGERTSDLVLAASEIATNSVRHATGRGVVRIWTEDASVICEVRDEGRITEPLLGRRRPAPDAAGGYGVWLVNQLCELVQLRTGPTGNVVRMHMRRR
jgi:anti-sigma regulatory factor (Ser/Thr protein kinase)